MSLHTFVISLVLSFLVNTNAPSGLHEAMVLFDGQPETAKHALQQRHIALTMTSLVAALRSPDAEVRELAAQVLAEDSEKDAIPAIIEALKSETVPRNQVNIAFFLAQLGDDTGLTTLRRFCEDTAKPGYIRMIAAQHMQDLHNDSCWNVVVDMLQSGNDPDARIQALSLVPSLDHLAGEDPSKVLDLIEKALHDQIPGVRTAASNTLGRLGNVSAIPYLRDALAKESDGSCRVVMQMALQRLQEKQGKEEHQ
jgi:HEAT repeat protein